MCKNIRQSRTVNSLIFYRGNTVRLICIHKSICDLFSVYLSGQWINDVHMSEPTEKYGINLIMSKAVATRIQPSHDISLFDYTAEFNFTEDHNGNGKGVVNILKSGIPCALRYGDWVIHPSVKFFFSWSGQNYCFDAQYKDESPIEVWLYNPSGVSIFKRAENANATDLQKLFESITNIQKYCSSAHYLIEKEILSYEEDLRRYCVPGIKISESQYQTVLANHANFIEKSIDILKEETGSDVLVYVERKLSEVNALLEKLPPVQLDCNKILSSIK